MFKNTFNDMRKFS